MRLGSAGTSVVTLRPTGYQFPGSGTSESRDWDANWLILEGSVTSADRPAWRFTDPCLTTWEAVELSRWLRAVAVGAIAPTPEVETLAFDGSGQEGVLELTEPTIAFSLASRDRDDVVLRVHLSLAASPPQSSSSARELFGSVVTIESSCAELVQAVEVWDRQVALFPPR